LSDHEGDIEWMAFLGGAGAISPSVRTQVENILGN
jgi:hypothetical protein